MCLVGSNRGGTADVYLSRLEVAVVDAVGALWRQDATTLGVALGALAERLRVTGSPRSVRMWLGADLCRPVRVAPIAGTRSRQERLQVARLTAVTESHLAAPCRVNIDPNDDGDDDLAVVVEESTLTAIEDALSTVRTRVLNIRPWWAEAMAAALRANASLRAFSVWEGRALTTLVGEGRTFSSAQTLYPVDSVEVATASFARAQVSAMVAPEDAFAVALDWSLNTELDVRPVGNAADAVFTPWVRRLGAVS